MTLTTQQVQRIFELVKLYIPYYDLQVEMVDHLASSIEEQMEQDASLSFEQALQIAYVTFGSAGFKLLVRKRSINIKKEKWKLLSQEFKKSFSTSQFYFTLLLFVSTYSVSMLWESHNNYFYAILSIFLFYGASNLIREYSLGKQTKYKLMLTEPFRASFFGSGIVLPQIFFLVFGQFGLNHIMFSLTASLTIVAYRSVISVNKKFISKAKQLYPEAFVKA